MATEPVEIYSYTAFPLTQDEPNYDHPVRVFQRKYGHFPAEIVVNPEHRVAWTFFPVRGAVLQSSGSLPSRGDIPGQPIARYAVAIKYEPGVGLEEMICKGAAERIE